jgi:hypothetical protein
LHYLDRILDRVPRRPLPEERDRVVVILRADLHLQVKVPADLRADGPHDVEHEPGAILERAAVLVLAIVDRRTEELGDQVAVRPMQLDAIEACLARAPRPLGKGRDDFANLRDRRAFAAETVGRIALVGGAEAGRILDAGDVPLPPAVTELHQEPAVVLVHRLPTSRQNGM